MKRLTRFSFFILIAMVANAISAQHPVRLPVVVKTNIENVHPAPSDPVITTKEATPIDQSRLARMNVSSPWWHREVQIPLGIGEDSETITADDASLISLDRSPDVQVIQVQPRIQAAEISAQRAAFDWSNYIDAAWNDRSDPIGSVLTTGSVDGRFNDHYLEASAGIRRQTTTGASIQMSQQMGWQKNNSSFLVPNPQSTSRLELSVTQPLMSGRGQAFNMRRVIQAQLTTKATQADSISRLQEYLLDVSSGYWELYRTRSIYILQRRAVTRARTMVNSLKQRATLDVTATQLSRTRATLERRKADLISAASRADEAVTNLRRLMGTIQDYPHRVELIPVQLPPTEPLQVDLDTVSQMALTRRSQIEQSIQRIQLAHSRLGVSRNQMLPQLDLIAGIYVAGLDGSRRFGNALGKQFVDGRPGYNFGFSWLRPTGNRAARANLRRRKLELQSAMAQYESTVSDVHQEVRQALTRVDAGYRTLQQRYQAVQSAREFMNLQADNWITNPNADGPASLLLEELIDAHNRLIDEEIATVNAEANFATAILELNLAAGTLLSNRASGEFPLADEESSASITENDPSISDNSIVLPADSPELHGDQP